MPIHRLCKMASLEVERAIMIESKDAGMLFWEQDFLPDTSEMD